MFRSLALGKHPLGPACPVDQVVSSPIGQKGKETDADWPALGHMVGPEPITATGNPVLDSGQFAPLGPTN